MRASRLLSILLTLQVKGRRTADQLAEQFEVSARTIYRDIDHLGAAGVPVYADRGPNGGFALLDGYRTRLDGLDVAEAEALLLSAIPDAAKDLGVDERAEGAQLKLLSALHFEARLGAERVASRFYLDPLPWYRAPESIGHLRLVAEAVWSSRRLTLKYESWKGLVERDVEPAGLVMKAGVWYLVARVENAARVYRISNIVTAVPGEAFVAPTDFDLIRTWKDHCRTFEQELFGDNAIAYVTEIGLAMLDRLGSQVAATARMSASDPDPSGRVRVVFPIETISVTARELFALGPDIEVLAPIELRDEIIRRVKSTASLYAREIAV
jgi:predicted DNA-binding transcriptional regulator YafY